MSYHLEWKFFILSLEMFEWQVRHINDHKMTKNFTSSWEIKDIKAVSDREEAVCLIIHLMHSNMTQNGKKLLTCVKWEKYKKQQKKGRDSLYIKKSSFCLCNFSCSFSKAVSEESPQKAVSCFTYTSFGRKTQSPALPVLAPMTAGLFKCSFFGFLLHNLPVLHITVWV